AMMPPDMLAANAAARYAANEKLQLEMSAPEVVGCWFRYYDGSQWRDNWNSLNRRGLPVAIEITLKMMPLSDVRKLRESPFAAQVMNGPGASTIIAANETAYANQNAANMAAMRQNASVAGSRSSSLTDYGGSSLTDRGESATLTDRAMQQNAMQNQPVGITVEQLAMQLDLLPPTEQRILIRVPTTPLTSQRELQREQPNTQRNQTAANPRQQAPRQTAQRTAAQPRGTAPRNTAAQDQQPRRQQPANRQQSPDWIRQ
ncbi:MAG: type II secretion system protein GspJ, partial [Planctomycetaceae bacterium]|nr:type II secretion system protein GspJ [Planctomycetaceae bacterium]